MNDAIKLLRTLQLAGREMVRTEVPFDTAQLKEAAARFAHEEPETYAYLTPRRYRFPADYYAQDVLPAVMGGCLTGVARGMVQKGNGAYDETAACGLITAQMLHKCGVPTLLVGDDLATALIRTTPPEQMLISDIEWPFPAMRFVLSREFSRRYLGGDCYVFTVARVPGQYEARIPFKIFGLQPPSIYLDKAQDGLLIWFSFMSLDPKDGRSADYHVSNPIQPDAKIKDRVRGPFVASDLYAGMSATDADRDVSGKREQKKILSPSLWAPRYVGRTYRLPTRSAPGGGTHASPVVHPRSAHWRWQRHGPGNTLKTLKRIAFVMVGAKSKDN